MRNEEQSREISSSFFIIRLAKFKNRVLLVKSKGSSPFTSNGCFQVQFSKKQFICMFGYWENEAEEKFNLTGFEEEAIGLKQISIRSCSQSQEITTPRSVRFFGPNQTGPLYITIVLQGGPVILAFSVVLHHIWILIWSDFEWRRPKNPRKIPQEKMQGPAS